MIHLLSTHLNSKPTLQITLVFLLSLTVIFGFRDKQFAQQYDEKYTLEQRSFRQLLQSSSQSSDNSNVSANIVVSVEEGLQGEFQLLVTLWEGSQGGNSKLLASQLVNMEMIGQQQNFLVIFEDQPSDTAYWGSVADAGACKSSTYAVGTQFQDFECPDIVDHTENSTLISGTLQQSSQGLQLNFVIKLEVIDITLKYKQCVQKDAVVDCDVAATGVPVELKRRYEPSFLAGVTTQDYLAQVKTVDSDGSARFVGVKGMEHLIGSPLFSTILAQSSNDLEVLGVLPCVPGVVQEYMEAEQEFPIVPENQNLYFIQGLQATFLTIDRRNLTTGSKIRMYDVEDEEVAVLKGSNNKISQIAIKSSLLRVVFESERATIEPMNFRMSYTTYVDTRTQYAFNSVTTLISVSLLGSLAYFVAAYGIWKCYQRGRQRQEIIEFEQQEEIRQERQQRRLRLPENLFNKLPQTKFFPVLFQQGNANKNEGSESEEENLCSICLCEYNQGEDIITLPCKHYFHKECISDWLGRSHLCPNCKHDVKASLQSNNNDNSAQQIISMNNSTYSLQMSTVQPIVRNVSTNDVSVQDQQSTL